MAGRRAMLPLPPSLTARDAMLREAIVALAVGILAATAAGDDDRAPERRRMVEAIERQAPAIGNGKDFAKLDARLLDAMRKVPRHAFVPASASHLAYAD